MKKFLILSLILSSCHQDFYHSPDSDLDMNHIEDTESDIEIEDIPDAEIFIDADIPIEADVEVDEIELPDAEQITDSNIPDVEDEVDAPLCPEGYEWCDSRCAHIVNDINNCGGCNITCSAARQAECLDGHCAGLSDCYLRTDRFPNCNDVCGEMGAISSLDCTYPGWDHLANPIRWFGGTYWPSEHLEHCESERWLPDSSVTHTVANYAFTCCCFWE